MILVGNVFDRIEDVGDESVQVIVTSPPYYKLRDYEGGEDEIGNEYDEQTYIDRLAELGYWFREKLVETGTFWLNIGDSFGDSGIRMMPHRVAQALVEMGWFCQLDNVWKKTRYMPNGGKSRPVLIHEYVFMFTKIRSGYDYYPDAIREPHSPVSLKRWKASGVARLGGRKSMGTKDAIDGHQTKMVVANPLGKLKASVWDICPSNYKGMHCAVMPEKLAETCILASTQPGELVLDPFAGSGTTGVVCVRHGREFVGIELNEESAIEAIDRIETEETK